MLPAVTRMITLYGQTGNFELNATMPIVTLKQLEAMEFSANVINAFTEKRVVGIKANEARAGSWFKKASPRSPHSAPLVGYHAAATIAHEGVASGKTVREVAQLKTCFLQSNATEVRSFRV